MPLRSLLRPLRALLPETTRHTAKRRMQDVAPGLQWRLPGQREQALEELQQCHSLEEYMAFARRYLGIGSVQRIREIEGAIGYLQQEAPRRVCEIGTEHGGTNFLLSHLLPEVETMIGVDLYVKHKSRLRAFKPSTQKLFLLDGSSYDQSMVRRVGRCLKGQQLDVLFIDGDHRYEGVRDDFLCYRHLVREGGLILFHDIVPDHAARFGQPTTSWAGGVPLLWNRLKPLYPHQEFVEDPLQDGLGIGVLRYSSAVALPPDFAASRDDAKAYSQLSFEKTC